MRKLFSAIMLGIAITASAQTDDEYFVTTNDGGAQVDSLGNPITTNMTAEERFLAENFRYLAPNRWPIGARFMVIPTSENQFEHVFYDRATDEEVPVASIRFHILEYKGHGTSNRGRTQIYFSSNKTGREYYHELRNLSFEAFCEKSNTGVPALAYLDDVDKTRELLVGKKMWTKTDEYCVDDPASSSGFTRVTVAKNLPIKIEKVGVGTREYPVKIVFSDERGNKYFQLVAMSRTNSGLRQDQFVHSRERNAFENSFLFEAMSDAEADKAKNRPYDTMVLRESAVLRNGKNSQDDNHANSWVNIAGGVVTIDMSPDDVILAKGQPHHRSSYSNRNMTWRYNDGTVITFKNGMVTSVKHK